LGQQTERLVKGERPLAAVNDRASVWLNLLAADVPVIREAAEEVRLPASYIESLRRDASLLSKVTLAEPKPTAKDFERLRLSVASLHLKAHNIKREKERPFVLTWAAGLPKKAKMKGEVFSTLQESLRRLESRVPQLTNMDGTVRETLATAINDCVQLRKLSDKEGVNLSEPYLLSLTQDAHLLTLAAADGTPVPVAFVYFQSAADDLHVKAESARAGAVGKKTPFDEVKTIVETKDRPRNQPQGGFEVWYVPKGLAGDPAQHKRFKQFSTPAVEERVPGCYEMWTKKGDAFGQQDEIDVKDNGKGECTVHLWIPA
jgi:hypothetical protein